MAITLYPQQERAIEHAISVGQVASVQEFIDRAIEHLEQKDHGTELAMAPSVFEQGMGLFGSAGDAALLDDVVALAYEERRHPGKQDPLL